MVFVTSSDQLSPERLPVHWDMVRPVKERRNSHFPLVIQEMTTENTQHISAENKQTAIHTKLWSQVTSSESRIALPYSPMVFPCQSLFPYTIWIALPYSPTVFPCQSLFPYCFPMITTISLGFSGRSATCFPILLHPTTLLPLFIVLLMSAFVAPCSLYVLPYSITPFPPIWLLN